MKVFINRPPQNGSTKAQLDALTSWLFSLTDTLNAAFSSVGEENLSRELRAMIAERNENDI